MNWFLSPKKKFQQDLAAVAKNKKDLIQQTQQLDLSLAKIHRTNEALKIVQSHVDKIDYSKQKTMIDTLALSEEYKETLKKSLDHTKEQTKETIKPLVEDAAKLQGNMLVAREKARQMIVIIDTQRQLLESGKIQADALKKLQKDGMNNTIKIKELVAECESMNKVTQDAVINFNSQQNTIDHIIDSGAGDDNWDSILASFTEKEAS